MRNFEYNQYSITEVSQLLKDKFNYTSVCLVSEYSKGAPIKTNRYGELTPVKKYYLLEKEDGYSDKKKMVYAEYKDSKGLSVTYVLMRDASSSNDVVAEKSIAKQIKEDFPENFIEPSSGKQNANGSTNLSSQSGNNFNKEKQMSNQLVKLTKSSLMEYVTALNSYISETKKLCEQMDQTIESAKPEMRDEDCQTMIQHAKNAVAKVKQSIQPVEELRSAYQTAISKFN